MKVKEELKNIRSLGYTHAKLGAKDGSGFVYCGPIDEGEIAAASEQVKLQCFDTARRVMLPLMNFELNYEKYINRAIESAIYNLKLNAVKLSRLEQDRLIRSTLEDAAKKSIKDYIRSSEGKMRTVSNCFKRLYPWVDLLEREVCEGYCSVVTRDTYIILFKGDDPGNYWDETEYTRRKTIPEINQELKEG